MKSDITKKQLKKLSSIVSDVFQLDITKNTRKRPYIEARSVYYKISKELTRFPLSAIGATTKKDHATVLHSIKNVFDWCYNWDEDFKTRYGQCYRLAAEYLAQEGLDIKAKKSMTLIERNDELRAENERMRDEILRLNTTYSVLNEYISRVKEENMEDFMYKLDIISKVMAK